MVRRFGIVLAFAAAALTTYVLFFRVSDEELVRRQVAALATAVGIDPAEQDPGARPLRVKRAFDRGVGPWVRVDITDIVEDEHARDELAGMAISAAETFAGLTVAFDHVKVDIDPRARIARVQAAATLSGTDHDGNPRHEVRPVRMRLDEMDGVWRLVSLEAPVGDGSQP